MKMFLLRITGFILVFVLLSFVAHKTKVHEDIHPNGSVYFAIEKSKLEKPNVSQIVLGDCMAEQLFRGKDGNDSIISLSSMAGIDLIGQYLLIKNFVSNNKGVEDIFVVINPFDFRNNLDHRFTYNYFLKPFYKREYLTDFNNTAKSQIKKIPFSGLIGLPPIAISFWTPDYNPAKKENIFLSRISIEYIKEIKNLCQKEDINLCILSAPLCESDRSRVNIVREHFAKEPHHNDLFEDYFERIIYLPDSIFMDPHHYFISKIPYVQKLYFESLKLSQVSNPEQFSQNIALANRESKIQN